MGVVQSCLYSGRHMGVSQVATNTLDHLVAMCDSHIIGSDAWASRPPSWETTVTTETTTAPLQIAVLDRGFVYVGHCSLDGGFLTVADARCVRRWGTSGGLGELAQKGPQSATKLDATGTVRAPMTALIHLIDCNPAAWAKA